jgi:hypothetical protein
VRARFPTLRTASYGHQISLHLQGAATIRSASWTADGIWLARCLHFAAARPDPMSRITCPSRTRLHARSQVLATHHSPDVPDNRPLSRDSSAGGGSAVSNRPAAVPSHRIWSSLTESGSDAGVSDGPAAVRCGVKCLSAAGTRASSPSVRQGNAGGRDSFRGNYLRNVPSAELVTKVLTLADHERLVYVGASTVLVVAAGGAVAR